MGLADRYVAAWNGHDPVEVAALFVEGGTYEDPTTEGPVAGQAVAKPRAACSAPSPTSV